MPHWLGTEHALKCKWMHLNASRRMSMQPSALDCNKRIVKPSKWTPNVCCLTLNAFWIFDKLHFILGGLHFRMFAFQLLMAHNRGHNTTFFVFFFFQAATMLSLIFKLLILVIIPGFFDGATCSTRQRLP